LDLFQSLEAELEARRRQYAHYRDSLLDFTERGGVRWMTLGEVFEMKAGQFVSASDISRESLLGQAIPCFGGNGLRGYVDRQTHDGLHLLIGRQGALCGNVHRHRGALFATEHAVVVVPRVEVDLDWAFHLLTSMKLNQYATKSAQPGLSVGRIAQLRIPLPEIGEQQRTARALDTLDLMTSDLAVGLPAELAARRSQYEYYRDRLLAFEEAA
jgi:type I restriction enzyme S subunit